MSLYFNEAGNKQGKIIVFIHGGGISGWMWKKQLEFFKDYYCIVPDLPEHGMSKDESEISIKGSAIAIIELIDKVACGKKVNIVGHSLGAKIVVEMLLTRPEMIERAVIASALYNSIPLMKFSHRLFIYKLTVSMLKIKWILNFEVKMFMFQDEDSIENLKKDFLNMTPELLYRIYNENYRSLRIPDELKKVQVPTLVIAGEQEPKAMRQSVIDITKNLPNSEGAFIKEGLNTYPWVKHHYFNEIIKIWIEAELTYDEVITN